MIAKQIGAENVAAVVIEPIAGEGGFIEPAEGFLPRIAEFCRANGIVFVADEVQTGFARTGDLFACEDEGIVPDIIATAKGIAGGLPLAAVTGRAEIMDKVHVGGLGGTYGGNPLACEAALGVLETIEERGPGRQGPAHRRDHAAPAARAAASSFDVIGDVRGRGAMIAIELVGPGTKEPNPAAPARSPSAATRRACWC